MPMRLLRDGILESEAVCSLTPGAEVFYRRLMSVVDDFGRYDGRPSVLKARLYALQIDKIRDKDIPAWLAECTKAGLISQYSVDGKPYVLFHKLGTPRAKESKFPPPPAHESICAHVKADESNGKQTRADAPYSYSGSYSNSSTYSESVARPLEESPEAGKPGSVPAATELVILEYPIVGAKSGEPNTWPLFQSLIDRWNQAYPGIDVFFECRKALEWTMAKPANRKTGRGMQTFLVSWLNRATNAGNGRNMPNAAFKPQTGKETLEEKFARKSAEAAAEAAAERTRKGETS